MEGYGQFCPVSKAAEVICQRWTPLILRKLLVGSSRFNEIRRGCLPAHRRCFPSGSRNWSEPGSSSVQFPMAPAATA